MVKTTAKELKAARTLLGLSQRQLAEKADVSLITLRRLESQLDYSELVSAITRQKVWSAIEAEGIMHLQAGDVALGRGIAFRDS